MRRALAQADVLNDQRPEGELFAGRSSSACRGVQAEATPEPQPKWPSGEAPRERRVVRQLFEAASQPARKIPRPPNAFMLFANEWRRRTAEQFPESTNKEVSVKLGQRWNSMSAEEKSGYYERARLEDKRHKLRYPGYVYSPQEARARKRQRLQAREERRTTPGHRNHNLSCKRSQMDASGPTAPADAHSLVGRFDDGCRWVSYPLRQRLPGTPFPAPSQGYLDDDEDGDILIFDDLETAREFLGVRGCCPRFAMTSPLPRTRRCHEQPPLSPDELTLQMRAALHPTTATKYCPQDGPQPPLPLDDT